MPTDYSAPDLGGFAGLVSLPFVIEQPSDGDDIDAASVNIVFEAVSNVCAAYLKYGVRIDGNATMTGNYVISGTLTIGGQVRYPAPHFLNGLTVDQTISAVTAERFIFQDTTTFSTLGNIVRLQTSGAVDGDRISLTVQNVGTIAGYCNTSGTVVGTPGAIAIRRGADDSQNICTIDNTNFTTGSHPILQGTTVEFQRISGLWRLLTTGPYVIAGAYA